MLGSTVIKTRESRLTGESQSNSEVQNTSGSATVLGKPEFALATQCHGMCLIAAKTLYCLSSGWDSTPYHPGASDPH